MNNEIELSLIIPAYNAESTIIECLSSVGTDAPSVEVLVIDDGSTDRTSRMSQEFAEIHSNVKYVLQRNSGVSSARNRGIDESRGKWIMFLDSDDTLVSNWVALTERSIANNKSEDVIVFEKILNTTRISAKQLIKMTLGIEPCKGTHLPQVSSKVYNKQFLIDYGVKFNPLLNNGEDMLFNITCYSHTDKVDIVQGELFNYSARMGSLSNSFSNKIIANEVTFSALLQAPIGDLFDRTQAERIMTDMCLNGLYVIMYRIAVSGAYRNIDFLKEIIGDSRYSHALKQLINSDLQDRKKLYILKLINAGHLRLAFVLMRVVVKIKTTLIK